MSDKSTFDIAKLAVPVLNGLAVFDFASFDAAPIRSSRREFNQGSKRDDVDNNTTGANLTVTAKMGAGIIATQRLVCGYDPNTDIDGLQLTDDDVITNIAWRMQPSGDESYYIFTEYYGSVNSVVTPDDASSGNDFRMGRFAMEGENPPIMIHNGGVRMELIDHTNGTGTLGAAFNARTAELDALEVYAVKVASDGKREVARFTNGGGYVTATAVAVPIHTTAAGDLPKAWNSTFNFLAVTGIWTGVGTHTNQNLPVTEMNLWSAVA